MKNYRYVLGIDPSGNFKEGKGTTGWSVFDRKKDTFVKCGEIRARDYDVQENYWLEHSKLIISVMNEYGYVNTAVSMEDFVLYANRARAQVNSAMETCQLIGVIKMLCYRQIDLFMRTASQVMNRWTDNILANKKYIRKEGKAWYTDCYPRALSTHIRDSMRHAVHCATFEIEKEKA